MADPFKSSRFSLDHANKRLIEFTREIVTFRKSDPYAVVTEPYPNSTDETYKVKLVKPFPVLSGTAMDILNALRSSLDQAGFASAVLSGARGSRAKFPFGETAAEAEGRRKPKATSAQVPKEIFDVMLSFQPYKGGQSPEGQSILWTMNHLVNTKKHETIVPTVLCVGNTFADKLHASFRHGFTWPPQWDRAKNEMELFSVPCGSKPKYKLQFQLVIGFDDPEVPAILPADEMLGVMLKESRRMVDAIESKARKMGLIHL